MDFNPTRNKKMTEIKLNIFQKFTYINKNVSYYLEII